MNTTDTTTTRPLAERITQGPATLHRDGWIVLSEDGNYLAKCGESLALVDEEMTANAELIAEAFNATHETKRTPRQLADERAELIAALDNFCSTLEYTDSCPDLTEASELLTRLQS